MTSLFEKYAQSESHFSTLLKLETTKANTVSTIRLCTIIALFGLGYFFYKNNNWAAFWLSIGVLFILFLVLVVIHAQIRERVLRNQILVKINQNEIAYLKGDLSPFEGGAEFVNPEHPFSYDLDIFGEQTLFQHFNRTTTLFGKANLAKTFQNPDISAVAQKQEAVKELMDKQDWRQHFQASGLMYADKNESLDSFKTWLDMPSTVKKKSILRVISFVLPAITVVIFICNFTSVLPIFFDLLKIFGLLNLAIVSSQYKHIKQEHELLTNRSASFQKYAQLLQSIENEEFTSEKLKNLKQNIVVENIPASQAIKKLSRILNQFDSILNPLVAIFSNGLFQYHLHALYNLAQWKETHGKNILRWFDVIAEFETLSSTANFAFNHPDFIFPTEKKGKNTEGGLMMKNVGHPLLPSDKRIGNDVVFNETSFIVLTGSNMSGKSTFLRTLGVNLVLAKMGSPVCAEEFSFYPYNIFVSMRVSDSLQNSESFFFAELKRLKRIITELENNQKTFVILDEILRGTNSNDKRAGTIGLIKNLMAHKAVGIIATHDLVIGDMEKDYPNYLQNKCFEVELSENGLIFDYKLHNGVAQHMSAAFLMEKMGIVNKVN
jgi:DNA mismatch repair ATPase MutS